MSLFNRKTAEMPTPETALSGRVEALPVNPTHFIFGNSMVAPFPEGSEQIMVGMGCFWGVERKFWDAPGIITTAVGYSAGYTENPTYEEVCTGRTGHNEVVLAVFDPKKTSYDAMLKLFWENHDPTQSMRQGNDVGTQYRSGIYTYTDDQMAAALVSKEVFQSELTAARYGTITTEIVPASTFYYAETYHQQYLAKNPNGYCGVGGTGVSCPIGLARDRG
jgi:peptide-methionine (S)-S-oxide reductase